MKKGQRLPTTLVGEISGIRVHAETKLLIQELMHVTESYEDTIIRVFSEVLKESQGKNQN